VLLPLLLPLSEPVAELPLLLEPGLVAELPLLLLPDPVAELPLLLEPGLVAELPLDLSDEPVCAQTGAVPIASAPISTAADESHLEYNILLPPFRSSRCALLALCHYKMVDARRRRRENRSAVFKSCGPSRLLSI
jgi:hypothetical protein